MPLATRKLVPALALFTAFGLLQTPLLVNLQLMFTNPALIPSFKFWNPRMGLVTSFLAGTYLLKNWKSFGTRNWWYGLAGCFLPYLGLKHLGLFYDHTVYELASASGTSVGGGAAMAHVPLFLALLGPIQFLSAAGFHLPERLKKLRKEA